jgi:hypothetical protein
MTHYLGLGNRRAMQHDQREEDALNPPDKIEHVRMRRFRLTYGDTTVFYVADWLGFPMTWRNVPGYVDAQTIRGYCE